MVSKLVTLSLLAALASSVNAYYWHVETVFGHNGGAYIDYKIHPVDIQFPENDAVVDKGGFPLKEPANLSMTINYSVYGYEDINMSFDLEKEELVALRAMEGQKEKATFPCVQMDEVSEAGDYWETVKRKVYSCGNPAYYGVKGRPKPVTTTLAVPTTTTVVATKPMAVAAALPLTSPSYPYCIGGYKDERNGEGPDGACCSHSDDCEDTCVKGICGVHP